MPLWFSMVFRLCQVSCNPGLRGGNIACCIRLDEFAWRWGKLSLALRIALTMVYTEDNKDKLVKYVSKKLAGVGRVVDFFMPMNEESKSEG